MTKNYLLMQKKYCFRASPTYMMILFPITLLIIFFFFLALFYTFNWIFRIPLILFVIYLVFRSHKEFVKSVCFDEEEIEVVHIFGYKSYISYEDVHFFNEQKIGFLPHNLILIKLKNNKKKTTFYCPKNKKTEFDLFLKIKGFKIRPQH